MSYRTGPGVPQSTAELHQFLRRELMAIERLYTRVEAEAKSALDNIGLLGDDGQLHPNEKLQVVLRYAQLTGEQAGIEAQATAYGITSEKTAYTTALDDLANYLNGLNPLWTDVTQATPIDRDDWNNYWLAATDARQVLQNKIVEVAGERASWTGVSGSGKPQDNATVGADWDSNTANRPAELTDGRVSEALSSDGQINDQSNLPLVQADVASVALSTVCTASDAGSTATIDIAAHSVQFGGFTVSYNAGSISGLNFSTKYYVYCDDPLYQGGAVTYYATTSWSTVRATVSRRVVDYITTPADGGSSSGGFDPGDCVAEGMWLLDGLKVDDAEAGDLIDVWDLGDVDSAKGPIAAIKPAHAVECVRIVMASGAEVVCSVTTPVTGPDGTVRSAAACLGMQLGVLHDNEPMAWERVANVEPVGPRTVYRLSCGNISFAAGADPQHRVITHNITYKP